MVQLIYKQPQVTHMNLFDAVPVIVNDMFSNYTPEQGISTGEIAMAVKNSILATDSLDYGNMKRATYSHVHTMVSNAIDLLINDKSTFFNVLYPDNLTPEQKLSPLFRYNTLYGDTIYSTEVPNLKFQ